MSRQRTELQSAAGKLISAIQKEWGSELGDSSAPISEQAMNAAHEILQASKMGAVLELLGGRDIENFLGELWVARHPNIAPYIASLEKALNDERSKS